MTGFHLGYKPVYFTLHLTGGSDFVQTMRTLDGADWPDGTVVVLEVDGQAPWPATVTGPDISWTIDRDVIDALPRTARTATLRYSDGAGTDIVWMTGQVEWDDD